MTASRSPVGAARQLLSARRARWSDAPDPACVSYAIRVRARHAAVRRSLIAFFLLLIPPILTTMRSYSLRERPLAGERLQLRHATTFDASTEMSDMMLHLHLR